MDRSWDYPTQSTMDDLTYRERVDLALVKVHADLEAEGHEEDLFDRPDALLVRIFTQNGWSDWSDQSTV